MVEQKSPVGTQSAMILRHSNRAVVLNRGGDFAPQETLVVSGNIFDCHTGRMLLASSG